MRIAQFLKLFGDSVAPTPPEPSVIPPESSIVPPLPSNPQPPPLPGAVTANSIILRMGVDYAAKFTLENNKLSWVDTGSDAPGAGTDVRDRDPNDYFGEAACWYFRANGGTAWQKWAMSTPLDVQEIGASLTVTDTSCSRAGLTVLKTDNPDSRDAAPAIWYSDTVFVIDDMQTASAAWYQFTLS